MTKLENDNIIVGSLYVSLFIVLLWFMLGCAHKCELIIPDIYYKPVVVEKRVDVVQYWEFDEAYNLNPGYYYEFKGVSGVWKWYDTGVMVWEY